MQSQQNPTQPYLPKTSKIKYHVIRQNSIRSHRQTQGLSSQPNIFKQMQQTQQYFPTCPSEDKFPFVTDNKSGQRRQKMLLCSLSKAQQLFVTAQLNKQQTSTRVANQSVYKQDKQQTNRSNTLMDLASSRSNSNPTDHSLRRKGSNSTRMPPILQQKHKQNNQNKMILKRQISGCQINQNCVPNQSKNSRKYDRWDKKVDKFLYQQSLVSEVMYNADLKKRCGDQYFQQILRNRHKEQMKPMPFVYSIKNEIEPTENKFIEYIKRIHPEVLIRKKLKLKGINRNRIKTQQDRNQIIEQKCKFTMSKLKTQTNL